jgi:hypothetical protein
MVKEKIPILAIRYCLHPGQKILRFGSLSGVLSHRVDSRSGYMYIELEIVLV